MVFVCTKCKRDVDTPGLFCPFCGTPAPPPESDATDPFIGRTIANKYFVNQRLGRGGMGQVYRATDVVLDRPVALKMLDRALLSDPSMVQRFHREGRAASRLNHPNCITILEFGQTEDQALFIAMEYLPGRPLSRLLAEEGPLDQGRVVRIVAQILSALADAHAGGVIHRDLKLSNVMVDTRRDEPDFVKVLDFGIAKLSEPGEGAGQLTAAGIVCGTPGYMSPEQARGEELDARSDLYAVGVILYELLTGRLPFESETPMGFVAKHMTEAPMPLRQRRPDLDIAPDLEALTERALAKERDDRPASAATMRDELLACRLPAGGRDRATPRPERSATVLLPAARRDTTPPGRRGPAPSAPGGASPESARVESPVPAPAAPRAPTPRPRREVAPVPPPSGPAAAAPRNVAPAARAAGGRSRRPRGRAQWGLIGGGVLTLSVLGAWLLLSDPFAAPVAATTEGEVGLSLGGGPGTRPPTPPSAPLEAPPAGGAPTLPDPPPAAPPAAVAPTPPPAPPPVAAPPAVPVVPPPLPKVAQPVAAPAPRPKKGSGLVAESEGLNAMKVPAAATGEGVLAVTASPWGVVSLDGRELGETPRELRLGEGYYHVKVSHPTLGAREKTIVVVAGRRVPFNVPFSGRALMTLDTEPRMDRSMRAALVLVAFLSGCSLLPWGTRTPGAARLTVVAGKRLNPDDQGQSLPTAIRVFQLTSAGKAGTVELLDLVRDPKAALGDDLLGVEELLVQPGGRVERSIAREKDARALLVAGLFRRPTGAAWRQLIELPADGGSMTVMLFADEYRIERR